MPQSNIGINLIDALSELGKTMVRHPKTTIGVATALTGLGIITNMANKIRGLHQITSESSKAQRMDYQTQLLRQIAENQKGPVITPKSNDPKIVIPPLR